jgi:hypothetical protein
MLWRTEMYPILTPFVAFLTKYPCIPAQFHGCGMPVVFEPGSQSGKWDAGSAMATRYIAVSCQCVSPPKVPSYRVPRYGQNLKDFCHCGGCEAALSESFGEATGEAGWPSKSRDLRRADAELLTRSRL